MSQEFVMYSGELEVQAKRKAIAVLQDEINRILNASRELSQLPEMMMKKDCIIGLVLTE